MSAMLQNFFETQFPNYGSEFDGKVLNGVRIEPQVCFII